MTAGDGLDRDAIERRADEAAECLALLSKPPTGFVARSAADVPALLAALKAAEVTALAVIRRLRDGWGWSEIVDGEGVWIRESERFSPEYEEAIMTPAEAAMCACADALRTEGGAS